MRAVCGRIKSDYRYSIGIFYNNIPWPSPSAEQRAKIVNAAKEILAARQQFPEASLADLHDPNLMPSELLKAHQANDRAVDSAYGYRGDLRDTARVAHLFQLYQRMTNLFAQQPRKRRRKAA